MSDKKRRVNDLEKDRVASVYGELRIVELVQTPKGPRYKLSSGRMVTHEELQSVRFMGDDSLPVIVLDK